MEAAGLHNSYPRRVIPSDLRVWLERVYLWVSSPFVGNDRESVNISLTSVVVG